MRVVRRSLQVLALVGTIGVGIVCLALIASQTPWFKDWLRRYVVRESKQYLNGELSIGGLGGNLFFGVNLSDVAIDVSGERVVAVESVRADYNLFQLLSGDGITISSIAVDQPVVHLEHDAGGWNLGRLVRAQEQEADREGPGKPIDLPAIALTNGTVTIDDRAPSPSYRLPSRLDDVTLKSSFAYAPVHYSVTLDTLSFRGRAPDLALEQLRGGISVHDDNLYVEKLQVRTGQSQVDLDGVIEQYLATPIIKVTTTGTASLPEIGRVVPAVEGYALTPRFDVTANGPASRLALDLDVKTDAGNVKGQVTTDLAAPNLGVKGTATLQALNLAPILKDPAQRSDLTGQATVDLTLKSQPESASALDRLTGTFAFQGPRVVAAGYQASNVKVSGDLHGPRLSLDGTAHAYGGTATARGTITFPAAGRALAFDLQGAADDLDLRNLPASIGAPRLDSDLSVAAYHVSGAGGRVQGTATLHQSTLEGATIADGTAGEFSVDGRAVSYAAHGHVSNLDLQRIGQAFELAALDRDDYATTLNSDFDVRGSGTDLASMRLEATGMLTGSQALGATLPNLAYAAHLDGGALRVHADGRVEGLDPGKLSGTPAVDGRVSGTVKADATVADISAPVTPEAVSGSATVHLDASTIGGLRIDDADVQATYASQVADIGVLTLNGPDVHLKASGQVALDKTSASNLEYHVEAVDLAALAKLAGQDGVAGSAVLDGRVTGNASSLTTTGTLNGSKLGYQDNNALDVNSQYTVTIPDLTPADAAVKATTSATFVKAGGLEINEVKATTAYAGQKLDFDASLVQPERTLEAAGDVVFHPDHQEIHLPQLAVRTQGIEWRLAPGSRPAIQYGGDRIQIENVRLVNGTQSLSVDGAFALKGTDPAGTLSVAANGLNLAEVDKLALLNRGVSGTLDATATIDGTAEAPAVSGHVQVANGGFENYRYDSLAADVNYQGTRVGLDATLQQSPTESITAKGSVPTSLFKPSPGGHIAATPGDTVDLQVTSTALGLGFLQGFTSQITSVTGTITANVHVGGSGADPHVDGYVDIKGGAFGVPATGVSYSGLDTRIDLTPESVHIPRLRIIDEEGKSLDIAGDLAVHARSVGAVDITISSNDFEIIDNELGDVGLETALKVTGELRRPRVEGDIKLQSARLEVDKILALFYDPYAVESLPEVPPATQAAANSGSAEQATQQALSRAGTSAAPAATPAAEAEAEAPAAGSTGAFAPVALDVHVRIPENLVLRGRNLRPGGPGGPSIGNINLTVGGDIDVRKEPGGPVTLLGTVDTVRGTYEFQSRRFDLVRGGTVRLTGDEQINPILDVSATREIPNTGVEAKVHITGTVQAPELELTSTPPLDESDILALIVFNRPVNELGSGERASLAATAGGIASGFLAQPLGQSIGRALDLDLFEITTSTDQGDLGAGITVGQQIGDRAFLKLQQQFGERLSTEFMLEFQIADYLRVQATGAPETTGSANRIGEHRIERAGIDLIFFFSY